MDRKNFLKLTGAFCGTVVVSGFFAACSKKDVVTPTANFDVDLSDPANSALSSVGGYVTKNNINIVRTAGGYVAFSAVCTHEGCSVNYSASANDFRCPCHGGVFNINGQVVSGPPPSALKQYTVTQNGNILSIT